MSRSTDILTENKVHRNIFASYIAGATGVLVGFPLDALKTRMQAHNYSSIWTCYQQTAPNGLSGLYRGVASPLMTSSIIKSTAFTVYEMSKAHLAKNGTYTLFDCFISGALAGACVSVISTPGELVKVQMQLYKDQKFGHSLDCLRKLTRQYGTGILLHGLYAQFLREVAGFGTYFYCYEGLCRLMSPTGKKADVRPFEQFVAGGVTGIVLWLVIFPLDSIKTKLQKDECRTKYRGWLDCFRQSYATAGIRGMYSGIQASLIRAFPVHSCIFLVYEACLRLIK